MVVDINSALNMNEIAKMILVLTCFVVSTNSSKATCIQCSAARDYQREPKPLCSKFDWSSQYIVNCPNSTMCYKKSYTFVFNGEEINGVEKGCAPQVQFGYVMGKTAWKPAVNIVENVYKEGCVEGGNKDTPGKPTVYCYCSSWLCNKSNTITDISSATVALHLAAAALCFMANFSVL